MALDSGSIVCTILSAFRLLNSDFNKIFRIALGFEIPFQFIQFFWGDLRNMESNFVYQLLVCETSPSIFHYLLFY